MIHAGRKKNMAKCCLVLLVAIFLLLGGVFFSVACIGPFEPPKTPEDGVEITIYLAEQRFSLTTSEGFLFGAIVELADGEGLRLEYVQFSFGRMLTVIGNEDSTISSNSFIAIYISILDPNFSSPQSRRVADTIFYSASRGADELPVIHGAAYLLVVSN